MKLGLECSKRSMRRAEITTSLSRSIFTDDYEQSLRTYVDDNRNYLTFRCGTLVRITANIPSRCACTLRRVRRRGAHGRRRWRRISLGVCAQAERTCACVDREELDGRRGVNTRNAGASVPRDFGQQWDLIHCLAHPLVFIWIVRRSSRSYLEGRLGRKNLSD